MSVEENARFNIRVASVSCSHTLNHEQVGAEDEVKTTMSPTQREVKRNLLYRVSMYDPDCPLADIEQTDAMFPYFALGGAAIYFALLGSVYWITRNTEESCDEDQSQEVMERSIAQTAFWVLAVSFLVQVIPLTSTIGSSRRKPSGILIAGLVVLFVSMATNALLAWAPSMIAFDKVTRSRVFLLRWAEWTPMAGLMTLLAESVDLPKQKNQWKGPMLFGFSQALSTFCGLVFPFCDSLLSWSLWMTLAFLTFLPIFPRVMVRRDTLLKTPRGRTVLEREQYDRRCISYRLMLQCSIVWSGLVALYFVNMLIHVTLPEGHVLQYPPLAMCCDTISDVIAKVIYTEIIMDAHASVFASDVRTLRQLNELKQLMSLLWVSSSDVIVISTQNGDGRSTTMLSPSFLDLVGANSEKRSVALVIEVDAAKNPRSELKARSAYYVDTTYAGDVYLDQIEQTIFAAEVVSAHVVKQGLSVINATWLNESLDQPEGQLSVLPVGHVDSHECICEIKVSRTPQHSGNTVVAVVRDMTERYKRIEAERRATRDMHTANRFTRHEVKNGLLSSIELTHTLRQAINTSTLAHRQDGSASSTQDQVDEYVNELDRTLHSILDTVLSDLMAREVVHEVYKPKLEVTDVPSVLSTIGHGINKERFPMIVEGNAIPKIFIDPQLLGYIHRNAVSNACKYGKKGGPVTTTINFNEKTKKFRLQVLNKAGDGHEELLAMGESANEFIFAQGCRLQAHSNELVGKHDSSGDGAWIMQKCAKTLGGMCQIDFTETGTTFTFECPAEPEIASSKPEYLSFVVPSDTWGIALDDSKVQRKLMNRIFEHVGVPESQRVLMGETPSDIAAFERLLHELLPKHKNSRFLLLIDEHLDYSGFGSGISSVDAIYSGSLIMERILKEIPASESSRVLAMMRSANDSAVDIALYTARTHGYFPKVTVQRDQSRAILSKLWTERFGNLPTTGECPEEK